MKDKEITDVIDQLDDQVVLLVKDFVRRRRDDYEKAALKLKEELKADVVKYTQLLDAKKINLADYELLVKGRASQLKIEILSEASISKSKFTLLSDEMVSLLLKTVITLITVL
jgi:hypothetical protein